MSERTDKFNPPVYTVILHYTSLFSCVLMPNVLISTVIMFRALTASRTWVSYTQHCAWMPPVQTHKEHQSSPYALSNREPGLQIWSMTHFKIQYHKWIAREELTLKHWVVWCDLSYPRPSADRCCFSTFYTHVRFWQVFVFFLTSFAEVARS